MTRCTPASRAAPTTQSTIRRPSSRWRCFGVPLFTRVPRAPDKEPRILEAAELRTILRNTLTGEQELLITTLVYTGMRRHEVRNLKWEDISPTSIRVLGKGGKLRHVPLHPALADVVVTQ